MALLGAHRLRAIDQPARPDALATSTAVVEQRSRCAPPPHRGQTSIAQKPPFLKRRTLTPT